MKIGLLKKIIRDFFFHSGSAKSDYYAAHADERPMDEWVFKSYFGFIYNAYTYSVNMSAFNKDVFRCEEASGLTEDTLERLHA